MRVLSHRLVDIQSDKQDIVEIDLSSLSSRDKIITSIRYWLSKSKRIQYTKHRKETIKQQEFLTKVDKVRGAINYIAYNELVKSKRKFKVKAIKLTIDRKYEEVLNTVLKDSSLVAYDITVLEVDQDMLNAFPSLPIMLRVEMRK